MQTLFQLPIRTPATYLSQQLLGAVAALDVNQGVVGVPHMTLTEGTQTQLHKGAVVQNLKPNSFHSAPLVSNMHVLCVCESVCAWLCACACVCVCVYVCGSNEYYFAHVYTVTY